MGRKIPGRKHRGVKDPEKQAAARLNSIKDKINAPPTNPDVQEVSKTLQRIINLKDKTKNGDFNIKKKKKLTLSKETNKNKEDFHQIPNESNKQFLNRINRVCENVKREAAFKEKYGVDIKRNEAGEVKVVKRPKDQLELLIREVRKEKTAKKVKKKGVDNEPKLTKSQKWQIKKKEKRIKSKQLNMDEFAKYKDPIKFGEIVHAPPTLSTPKKVEKVKPQLMNKKLLLSALIQKSGNPPRDQVTKEKDKLQKVSKTMVDKKGKRKDLPNSLRRQLDKQQKEIIDAYKLLKAKKLTSS